jgi:multiple sugar transport system substrate-binding protein
VTRGRAAIAMLLWSVLAVGCGEPPDDAAPLTFWALGSEGEVVERMLPDFEARHPGVRVKVQRIPWSAAHEKLLTAWVGGAMPDVVQVGNTWIPELVVLGAVEPLDDRLDAAARAAFFPGVLDPNVVDGRLWGVPWYVDTRLVFYRRDLLAAAGWDDAPGTWDAWRAGMRAVQARARPGQHAILLPLTEWQPLVILALGYGATLLRDGDCRGDFRSPAFRAALSAWVELFREGLAPLGGAALAANLYDDFARGDVAFVVTGPWNLGEMARRLPRSLSDAWATTPMPAVHGAPPGPSLAGGASLVVVRGTPRAEAAWQLVAYLSEPAQQRRLWELTGDLPARRDVWNDPALAGDARVAAFRTQLEAVRATPKIPEWERIAGKIMQWADAAVRGTLDVDAATARLDAEVDEILAKRRWLLGDRCTGATRSGAPSGDMTQSRSGAQGGV